LINNYSTFKTTFTSRYECGLIDILYQSEIGVWILAFRAVASRPRDFFLSNDFPNVAKRQSNDDEFEQLCRLVTHEGSDKFLAPELMKEALVIFHKMKNKLSVNILFECRD
jgi:hypothetical protein